MDNICTSIAIGHLVSQKAHIKILTATPTLKKNLSVFMSEIDKTFYHQLQNYVLVLYTIPDPF